MSLRELAGALQYSLLVCAVERNGEVYIPDGNFVIQAKDSLSIITTPQNAESLFKKIGVHTNKVHSTMIVGGGEITYYLAKSLANMNVDVKIIEKNKDRCEVLSEALPDATVIYGAWLGSMSLMVLLVLLWMVLVRLVHLSRVIA